MKFNRHTDLAGMHAFLSPSSYHWINYDEEKMRDRFVTSVAARRGSELHQLAHDLIKLKVRLPANGTTLSMYVNDVLGFRMEPEQILMYSPNCFGTADGLGFRANLLRIYDLKTGETKTSVNQLLVYAALFCLEYGFKPGAIKYDLRIYQNDERMEFETDPADVAHIMDKIITFDNLINEWRQEDQ